MKRIMTKFVLAASVSCSGMPVHCLSWLTGKGQNHCSCHYTCAFPTRPQNICCEKGKNDINTPDFEHKNYRIV